MSGIASRFRLRQAGFSRRDFLPATRQRVERIGRLRTIACNEIVDKLNVTINASVADPTFKEKLADLAMPRFADTPADFGRLIAAAQAGDQARRHRAGMTLTAGRLLARPAQDRFVQSAASFASGACR